MRSIWHLTWTDAADELPMGFEVNSGMVVVAESRSVARQCAAAAAIDEPADLWLLEKYSRCSKIGVCTNNRVPSGVVVQENNAS